MLARFRRFVRDTDRIIWLVILGVVVVAVAAFVLNRSGPGTDIDVLQVTLNAAGTQSNLYVPTLASNLTQTPVEAALTGAAPTLSLSGQQQVRQFAAAASDPSEAANTLEQGAVQAVGPPNTPDCGDYRTAWATSDPSGIGSLNLIFAELVTPSGILVYESFNPGFITRIDITDIYGEIHNVYEAAPQLQASCPMSLVVAIPDADYKANFLTIYVDQRGSPGGAVQIDAVELVGIKH